MMRCRLLVVFSVCFLVAVVVASATSVPGVNASIGATATVSQPLGLINIPPDDSHRLTSNVNSRQQFLLAPKTSGVIVLIDGAPVPRNHLIPTISNSTSAIDLSSVQGGAIGITPTVVTLIYSEN
jgi:hypothetical protein